ncbi:uncharacterized protein LOC110018685 [Phalaenopsis equestris]|uniref:uncharacterized protein LOC110018685 n=1 Tax=Phalaenopsis equestris TaxID=78828 RepID=UPI0009E1D338|nr:uncharacterized protein LOC110018685 [Phalaenopsis equestris]
MLTVKLQLVKLESKDKSQVALTRALSPYPFFFKPKPYSTRKFQSFNLSHNQSINLPETDATSHDNESRADSLTKQKRSSMLLCLSTTKRSNKGIRHTKGCAKDEDDIDDYLRRQSCVHFLTAFKKTKVRPEENFKPGKWERKKLVSRDEKIELVTDVFLASIDQCSKKAAGGSACTVLAAIIADWLHKNPESLPLQNQFDELVLKGSLEWRNLCGEENHKAKFSDKHFDLDTVLEAKVRSLMVATEKSYVGFFSMDEMPEGFDWLQGEMCFDNIWNNILCVDETDERIYIVSWNDHFFVLKVEREAIYLLDTLGGRLAEGCKRAYILKFDAESAIYRRGEDGKESRNSQDLVSEGIGCCKEYIKGFLSAIPLRELQKDIKRGQVKQELLHRLLQIDFHCTTPCSSRNS